MTDLATIRIPVDSSDMVQAVRDAKALENNVNTLVKAFSSGAIGSGQFQKGLLQLKNNFKDLFTDVTEANLKVTQFASNLIQSSKAIEQAAEMRNWFSAQRRRIAMMQESERIAKRQADEETKAAERIAAAQEKATQAILKQRAAAAQAASTKASNFQAGIGPNLGLGAQGISAAASASAFEQEIEKLRQKYDKVYVASQLYEQQLNEIVQAERLGILSKQQYQKQLDALNMEYEQFANSAENAYIANNRFSQHVNATGRGLNNFGFVAQQVGYQVGDFFVQIQSGTNAFVAFGQQATQLAGLIPGVWGAIAGIGISLATAYLAYKDRTSEAAIETDNFKNSLKSLEEQTISTKNEMLALASGYESASQGAVLRKIIELEIEAADLRQQAMEEEGVVAQDRANRAIALERQAESLRAKLEEQKTVEEQLAKLKKEQEEKVNKIYDKLSDIADIDISGVFTKALPAAQTFLEKLREIAGAYAEYGPSGVIPGTSIPRGKFTEDGMTAAARSVLNNRPSPFGVLAGGAGGVSPSTSRTGSTGGGSKANPIESLINQLQTQREVIDEWYATSQDTLKNASESELQIIGGYNEAKLRLEKEYQDRLKGIRDEGHVTALGDAETFFGGMAAIAQAGGDRAVKAMRVFSAAQALINSYVAFTEVLKDPSFIGRPFARFGAAASALSSGLAAVAAIKGGGSGGGSMSRGSATVATSSNSAPAPQTVFIDSISPESLYSGETLINLFEAFYDENDKRGKVFMVAR